jgi:hypothetical protein
MVDRLCARLIDLVEADISLELIHAIQDLLDNYQNRTGSAAAPEILRQLPDQFDPSKMFPTSNSYEKPSLGSTTNAATRKQVETWKLDVEPIFMSAQITTDNAARVHWILETIRYPVYRDIVFRDKTLTT